VVAVDVNLILVQLFFLVLLGLLAAVICQRFKVPVVVGEILVGIGISNIFINGSSLATVLNLVPSQPGYDFLNLLAQLGIIFLLFGVGLVTPFSELRQIGRMSILVALLGVILPFFAGLAAMIGFGYDVKIGVFMGAAMVATSVGITARVVHDLGRTETIEARVIIAAAVIDDVMGLIVLALVSGISKGGALNVADIAVVASLAVLFVLVVMYISTLVPKARRTLPVMSVMKKQQVKKHWSPLPFALIICFGLSALAAYLNLAAIVGAFLAGMLFAEFRDVWPTAEKFGPINEFLVPFFFLFVGIQVDISSFGTEGILLLMVVIIVIAILTKVVGCGLGAWKLGRRSATVVGVGMIPRGEVGIIVATIGLSSGVIQNDLYTTVVAMSLVTTLVAPPLISYAFKRKERHVVKRAPSREE